MKTIIVATDFSRSAETALKYATFISKFTSATIVLVNYYRFNIHALNARLSPKSMGKLVQNNQKHLESYAKQASLKYSVPLKSFTITSLSQESLSEFAEKCKAGMIIMGMRQDYSAYLSSENISTNIILHSKIPVLVIPEKVEFKFPEKVLYACDYQTGPHKEHLSSLKEIINSFDSELQVFHVWRNQQIIREEEGTRGTLVAQIENSIGTVQHTYRDLLSENIIAGLEEGIKDFKADILVMSPHRYNFWNSLFHKSKTLAMAFKSSIPLLSLPS